MSLYKNYYIIAGYDLTGYSTEKYEDWKWTDEGEQYICRQSKGNIQLFDDPCNGEHLYLGYVLANGDQYEFKTEIIDINLVRFVSSDVFRTLLDLTNLGVIKEQAFEKCKYKVFAFEEVN